jgi:CRISPR-associated protein Cmr3
VTTASSGAQWRSFQLTPDDLLFFRDGKPSSLGDDHYLRSVFPPQPSTLYGAVRSRRLVDAGADLRRLGEDTWTLLSDALRAELGAWGGFGTLELRGPWLVKDGEPLLPAPLDLAIRRTKAPQVHAAAGIGLPPAAPEIEEVVRLRRWTTGDAGAASHPLALVAPPPGAATAGGDDAEPPRDWWLPPAGLAAWQAGGVPEPSQLVHRSRLWVDEPRTGVGLEADRRSSAEGLIYTFGFIRLAAGVAVGFEVRGGDLRPGRRLRLGGEGRTCWLEEGPSLPAAPAAPNPGRDLRVCLATPALWETGALPPDGGGSADSPFRGADLVAAVVPGSIAVGGWDLAKRRAKPMRRAVPAGSVYFLRAGSSKLASNLVHELHGSTLSTFPGEHLAQQGFGLVAAGHAPPEASDG